MIDKPQSIPTSSPEHFQRLANERNPFDVSWLGGELLSSPDCNARVAKGKGRTECNSHELFFAPIPGFDPLPILSSPRHTQHEPIASSRDELTKNKPSEIASITDKSVDSRPEIAKVRWTFAIDLTADLISKDGSNNGAQRQREQLKQLIELSRGQKDVTIAIQVADTLLAPLPPNFKINRYTIHDGVMKLEETIDSQGMAKNLEGFMKFATTIAPSEKIGLAIQSHGLGGRGVVGGTGSGTLTELTESIRIGLKGSGHSQLDVLDFDSCSMATPAVLASVRSVASYVVASEELQFSSKNFDGQNLPAVLTDLLKDPDMSAADLSRTIVEGANRGAKPEEIPDAGGRRGEHVGADTIASFDSRKIEQFNQALDEFGGLLLVALQNPQTRKAISELIDGTKRLETESDITEPDTGNRDLKEFMTTIKTAAENGVIPDPDGSIVRAVQKVLDAQAKMTTNFEKLDCSKVCGKDTRSGLYTLLPVREVRDGLPPGLKYLLADSSESTENSFANKERVLAFLEHTTTEISAKLSDSAKLQFQPVIDAINKIRAAQTAQDFRAEMRALNNLARRLEGTNIYKELKDHVVKAETISGANKWNRFVREIAGVSD